MTLSSASSEIDGTAALAPAPAPPPCALLVWLVESGGSGDGVLGALLGVVLGVLVGALPVGG